MTPRHALEMRVPPLVALASSCALVWVVVALTPEWTTSLAQTVRQATAAALALIGVAFMGAGVSEFRRHETTVNPMRPESSSKVVDSGVYAWTRNPMYLGMHLGVFAWAVLLGNLWGLVAAHAFVAYIARFQIAPEERVLSARFGAPYVNYTQRVRRWLGRKA
jgi:protein-S-isoprenylcysteine O-methyltransferase Ste14